MRAEEFTDSTNWKTIYLAFVLSDQSVETLKQHFPVKFEKAYYHHVTIKFAGVTQQDWDEWKNLTSVRVVGLAEDESLQAAIVELNGVSKRADGSTYHITLSIGPTRKPVDSNKVIASGNVKQIDVPFELSGIVQKVPK